METVYIYGLVDPRTDEIKYIGITKRRPEIRLADHLRTARNNTEKNIHKASWINQLLEIELEPRMIILEICSKRDASDAEIWWIVLCRVFGCNLTNLTDGGEIPPSWAGKFHTEETKQKQSKSISEYYKENDHPAKGVPKTKEHIEKMIETKIKNGTHFTNWLAFVPEKRAKEIYIKRTDNEAWRNNLSKSAKKRLIDPTKNPMYGKKQSPESIAKNRLSNEIYAAYKKGEYDYVAELQEEFKQLTGHYQPNYAEFCYV